MLKKHISKVGEIGYRFYSVPESYPINHAKGEVLILTASDQPEGVEYLISEPGDVMFHIAANTRVSNKLYKLAEQPNVKVYSQISKQDLDMLWDK